MKYRVLSGDSLSRIASRVRRPGVSLDQMLVSLFRGNPQAFMGDNMNRLKAGAVLTVPSADNAQRITASEARSVIQAQSSDFAAYRQRLAGGVTTRADEGPARQSKGSVQARVDDRKQGAATSPDRLTLSQGALKASAPEAQDFTRGRAQGQHHARGRTVAQCRGSQEAAEGSPAAGLCARRAAKPAPAPAPAAAVTPVPAPAAVQASVPARTLAPTVAAPVSAASPVAASRPAAAVVKASAPAPGPRSTRTPASSPACSTTPWCCPAPACWWRCWSASACTAAQPGARSRAARPRSSRAACSPIRSSAPAAASASTRARRGVSSSSASSSMSYSLSQLDAIGDVDPVAEADVYLAYGRDLQAEEILKEAMRANPAAHGHPHQAARGLRQAPRHQGLRTAGHAGARLTRGAGEGCTSREASPSPCRAPVGNPEPLGASTLPHADAAGSAVHARLDLDLKAQEMGLRQIDPDKSAVPAGSRPKSPSRRCWTSGRRVHAVNQVVHIDAGIEREAFSWVRGTNRYLPADIAVQWCRAVSPHFHARNSARGRRYRFVVLESPVRPALEQGLVGWVFRPLDGDAMRRAASALVGEHDFSSFRAAGCQAASPVKTLNAITIERRGAYWRFDFDGSAFLHHMVRNILGCLVAVGSGSRPADWMSAVLAARRRDAAAPTFAADGLYFLGPYYDAEHGIPTEVPGHDWLS
jgi:tRNA pseudouridine38-40 synthase